MEESTEQFTEEFTEQFTDKMSSDFLSKLKYKHKKDEKISSILTYDFRTKQFENMEITEMNNNKIDPIINDEVKDKGKIKVEKDKPKIKKITRSKLKEMEKIMSESKLESKLENELKNTHTTTQHELLTCLSSFEANYISMINSRHEGRMSFDSISGITSEHQKIIGGNSTRLKAVVNIFLIFGGVLSQAHGTGTMLTPKHVLTCGHLLFETDADNLVMRDNIPVSGFKIISSYHNLHRSGVKAFLMRPRSNESMILSTDVMVIELDEEIPNCDCIGVTNKLNIFRKNLLKHENLDDVKKVKSIDEIIKGKNISSEENDDYDSVVVAKIGYPYLFGSDDDIYFNKIVAYRPVKNNLDKNAINLDYIIDPGASGSTVTLESKPHYCVGIYVSSNIFSGSRFIKIAQHIPVLNFIIKDIKRPIVRKPLPKVKQLSNLDELLESAKRVGSISMKNYMSLYIEPNTADKWNQLLPKLRFEFELDDLFADRNNLYWSFNVQDDNCKNWNPFELLDNNLKTTKISTFGLYLKTNYLPVLHKKIKIKQLSLYIEWKDLTLSFLDKFITYAENRAKINIFTFFVRLSGTFIEEDISKLHEEVSKKYPGFMEQIKSGIIDGRGTNNNLLIFIGNSKLENTKGSKQVYDIWRCISVLCKFKLISLTFLSEKENYLGLNSKKHNHVL
jgi:hypothetical protein